MHMAGLALTPISGGKSRTPLADIDQSVIDTVEEALAYFADNDGRLETETFTSLDVADNWLRDARAYAYQRQADGKPARVVVSGNPARAKGNTARDGSGPYVVRFIVEPYTAPAASDQNAG